MLRALPARAMLALVSVLLAARAVEAAKTDLVFLANGDRITGEIDQLNRGRLTFKTDDAGTIDLEWDKISRVEATRFFEVGTTDGRRFLGSLGKAPDRSIAVVGPGGTVTLAMAEVTLITPIRASFWRQLEGSVDAGFSYTRSSGIAQLNVNSDTVFRRPAFAARATVSATATQQEDGGRDDRGALDLSYVRYRWPRWFVGGAGRFETNESLGLRLRSQVGAAIGPRLVNTNRAQLYLAGGLVVNDERGVDVEATQNLEALLAFGTSYFTYDRPKTTLDVTVEYYPSLSNEGRQRLQLDASAKREVLKDFYVSVNFFDSFDSRPPNPVFATNDVGIVVSLGWSY